MGKMNSLLENFITAQQTQGRFLAQPQQNPKPANYIDETHEQVHAIITLRSGKEIDKTIAPKEVNHGKNGESRRLIQESESEKKKTEEKDHESNSELFKKASNEITMEHLKHASFPHRLTKASKTNLNAEIYDIFKQVRIKIPMLDAIKQIPSYAKFLKDLSTAKKKLQVTETAMVNESQILQCKSVPKYKDPSCPTVL
ncbi:hypothetical protein Acr_11g0010270 [Actinidia rufa]|uniref:Retrotransposon gag protein n=1 Tax=Actinidia rufa TaxID=165716 RepID=A0A7J0FDG1_9ERIC|nr:hypothetical protein Acr_11g0010270 [Actinidia rufa]